MRTTKAVLCAAALAAGAVTSMAQSNVYSLNVVGYVNATITGSGQYTMLANPLNNTSGGNSISNLFAAVAQNGDSVYRWDYLNYDFSTTTYNYNGITHVWSPNPNLNIGEGFWYIDGSSAGVDRTVTFVGEVFQGSFTNTLHGNGYYNAIGSSVPLGGSFTNSIGGLTPTDGDNVYPWDPVSYDFSTIIPGYNGVAHTWTHTEVQVPAGIGMIYISQNPSDTFTWVRSFTVQ